MSAMDKLEAYLVAKNTAKLPQATPKAPNRPFSGSKNSTAETAKSGLILPVRDIRTGIGVVSQTAGSPAIETYEDDEIDKKTGAIIHKKGEPVLDEKGNPKLIPQLSGFNYMSRDIQDLRNLKEQLLKHREAPRNLTGTMRMLKAVAGEKDLEGYKPEEDAAAALAAQLQKHQAGILKGNEAFTEAQIAMLGKLITPPQRILQTLQASESGNKATGGGEEKLMPQFLQKRLDLIDEAKRSISGIESKIGTTLEKAKSLPGFGAGTDIYYGIKGAIPFGGLLPGEVGAEVRALATELASGKLHERFGSALSAREAAIAQAYLGSTRDQLATLNFLRRIKANLPEEVALIKKRNPTFADRMW